jgi:hypothetical protein
MQVGKVQKIIALFNEAFTRLGVDVSLERLEGLAVMIHRAMTAQARNFHTLDHVFAFVDSDEPIRTLAALYHDIVYFQVDMGFSAEIWDIISPYIRQERGEFYVSDSIPEDDEPVRMALDVFNLTAGDKLSSVAALNEFLSALVMIKAIGDLVTKKNLIRMLLCIEATIPFRGLNAQGQSHFEWMAEHLRFISEKYQLLCSQEEIDSAIKTATLFANKDIENFAEYDPGRFLDNTWRLLPETNAALRLPDVYSIGTYRQALVKMYNFFSSLDAKQVFHQYQGIPSDEDFHKMIDLADNNISTACEYLRIKILGIAVLEALAVVTGGDAPLSLFLGDVPREGTSIKRLEYFLPEIESRPWVDRSSTIYRLLESGRASDTSFDMKNSPLSLFVYKCLPPVKFQEALKNAHRMFRGEVTAAQFISMLDTSLIQPIAQASAMMVITRREKLSKYAGLA